MGRDNRPKAIPPTIVSALTYDPVTGIFRWAVPTRGHSIGDIAGHVKKATGYRFITFEKKSYPAARVAWFVMTGKDPMNEIDHKDRHRANDAWDNLREATHSQNLMNCGPRRGKSHKGVLSLSSGRFVAKIRFERAYYFIGNFATVEEASAAYYRKSAELAGEFSYQPETI